VLAGVALTGLRRVSTLLPVLGPRMTRYSSEAGFLLIYRTSADPSISN
jgi:hypothetical protein